MMEGNNNSSNSNSTARVRVLPGSTLSLSNPPPPPSHPPPQPVHLCKIAVIGNPTSGKSSLVNKFLTRKSAAASAVNNNKIDGGGDNNSAAAANDMTVQWCNASATSNGTFGSALGASLIGPIGSSSGVGGTSEHTATLAEYYKKDISLKRRGGRRSRRNKEQRQEDQTTTATCVRAQVWDINVPQAAIINNPHHRQSDNKNDHKESDLNNSPDYIKSTSSIITSQQQQQQQIINNNNNNVTNSLLAPLLPLLKRINGIIIACQCPLPPTTSTKSSLLYSSNASHASHASYNTQSSIRSGCEWYWEELDLLEEQIAHWITFVRSSHSSHNQNTIIIILTYADLAIIEYSPKEWMKLSVKMDEICRKFGIHSWRMGTCVSSSSSNNSSSGGSSKGEYINAKEEEEMNNNFISRSKQQQQQHQYGLFQRMAIQQQRLLEDMEDSVEGTFIDLILSHLDK